jgi:hypothetical protein
VTPLHGRLLCEVTGQGAHVIWMRVIDPGSSWAWWPFNVDDDGRCLELCYRPKEWHYRSRRWPR